MRTKEQEQCLELKCVYIFISLCHDQQVSYLGSLIGLTLWSKDYGDSTYNFQEMTASAQHNQPDKMVAYFAMIHVAIWVMVAVLDRYILSLCTCVRVLSSRRGCACIIRELVSLFVRQS